MVKVMAPFTPFLTENMYQNLKHFIVKENGEDINDESVHYLMLPKPRCVIIYYIILYYIILYYIILYYIISYYIILYYIILYYIILYYIILYYIILYYIILHQN